MKCLSLALVLLLSASAAQATGQQESDANPEKPKVSFFGFLKDESGQKPIPVKNITINGRYKEIPLYAIPKLESEDPTKNPTFFDLENISSLRTVSTPNGMPKPRLFNNRRFIEVIVLLKKYEKNPHGATAADADEMNNEQNMEQERRYLTEASTRISCEEDINNAPKRKPLLEAVESLVITGYREQEGTGPQKQKSRVVHEREHACSEANKIIKDLQQESVRCNNTHLNKLINSTQDIIGTLCSADPLIRAR